ncbi:LPXTG cell wall anchor domain-containing protein [Ferruginibacter sp. HRS2-29]|uniref:LPXTG cell wall anchor domain-containing protein n=1 Tax=Ferruginibacter sp. HRS2-29 TaxID=2487334 RepID=UPI0020CC104E|nr:LPXTG cell wall anchor domain-containing protein [Ferruginibacter sp. HRS2-29]MCP9750882.1 LPXTG cell wall anchor domain-containing protein [Ferruginibacter sp. HRS2-29]
MEKKKAVENALLAVIGIGLITTAVVLLSKRKRSDGRESSDDRRITSYDDYEDDPNELRAFSETGIYL